jgi:hypothetical protein
MIDIGRSIQHPFEDKDWATKMLIGAGVSLVPVLQFAMNGYALDVLRNTARGQDVPLPRWDDLGRQFIDGLKLFAVQLIYSLPILVFVFGLVIVSIGFGITADQASRSTRDAMGAGFAIVSLAVTCLSLVYALVVAFLTPAMYIQVARTGQIGAAFHFNEIGALIRGDTGAYLLAVIVPVAFGLVFAIAISVLMIIPFVGACLGLLLVPVVLLLSPYFNIVIGHMYGQLIKA